MELDENRLAELERDERWLAAMAKPALPPETLRCVRLAVHATLAERCLDGAASPVPSPAVLAGAKRAARAALSGRAPRAARRWMVGLSAAAVIIMAIGLGRSRLTPAIGQADALSLGEEFVAAWNVLEERGELSSLTTDMAWLESEMEAWASKSTDRAEEWELESLHDRIDQLLCEPEEYAGTS